MSNISIAVEGFKRQMALFMSDSDKEINNVDKERDSADNKMDSVDKGMGD